MLFRSDQYMRSGQGFICVYAITSHFSFDEITSLREEILRAKDEDDVPMVLVGNKTDLEEERKVTTAEGKDLAKTFGCQFYESSAKARINVQEAFYDLVRAIRKRNDNKSGTTTKPKKKKGCKFM